MEGSIEIGAEELCMVELDRDELEYCGRILDQRPATLRGRTVGMALAEKLLLVRTREGRTAPLKANAVQRAFEERRGERNIVLKARQMGLTTWAAARFFLKTITQPGTLTLEVAHTQEAAEEIFRIVHRFLDWLPEELREGPLRTSRANVRQIVFPEMDAQYRVVSAGDRNAGRGLTVQNLHCSELARWPGDPAETLAGLRAAMAPGAELILESTPDGVGGCFLRGVAEGRRDGDGAALLSVVDGAALPGAGGGRGEPDGGRAGADARGMGWIWSRSDTGGRCGRIFAGWRGRSMPRTRRAAFWPAGIRSLSWQRSRRGWQMAPEPVERRRNGELEIWLPPVQGKQYLVAVDPAGGGSEGDYSAAQVLEMETGLQCAEFAGHVGGLELARLVTELAAEYNQAWLVVERNNHGSGVLALAGDGLRICADLPAGRTGGVADDIDEPAGGAGAAGCGAGGAAGAVS